MIRFDLRWIHRHPLRWLRLMWLPWCLAAVLLGLAWVVTDPVFAALPAPGLWPLLLSMTAGVIAMSALAPLEPRVQAAAAGLLFGVSSLRVMVFIYGAANLDGVARVLAIDFALHWIVLVGMAVSWPRFLRSVGRDMTAASGEDDRASC